MRGRDGRSGAVETVLVRAARAGTAFKEVDAARVTQLQPGVVTGEALVLDGGQVSRTRRPPRCSPRPAGDPSAVRIRSSPASPGPGTSPGTPGLVPGAVDNRWWWSHPGDHPSAVVLPRAPEHLQQVAFRRERRGPGHRRRGAGPPGPSASGGARGTAAAAGVRATGADRPPSSGVTITYEWRGAVDNAVLDALHAEGFDHPAAGPTGGRRPGCRPCAARPPTSRSTLPAWVWGSKY